MVLNFTTLVLSMFIDNLLSVQNASKALEENNDFIQILDIDRIEISPMTLVRKVVHYNDMLSHSSPNGFSHGKDAIIFSSYHNLYHLLNNIDPMCYGPCPSYEKVKVLGTGACLLFVS